MPDTTKVIVSAMSLRAAAPQEWDEFVMCVRQLAAAQVGEMLRVPPEVLPKAQGMAQAMNEFSQALVDAPKLFDRIQTNRRPHADA